MLRRSQGCLPERCRQAPSSGQALWRMSSWGPDDLVTHFVVLNCCPSSPGTIGGVWSHVRPHRVLKTCLQAAEGAQVPTASKVWQRVAVLQCFWVNAKFLRKESYSGHFLSNSHNLVCTHRTNGRAFTGLMRGRVWEKPDTPG